jgi:hypothetical protein
VCHQFIIAGSGAFDVAQMMAGSKRHSTEQAFFLRIAFTSGIWAHELNFSARGNLGFNIPSLGYMIT